MKFSEFIRLIWKHNRSEQVRYVAPVLIGSTDSFIKILMLGTRLLLFPHYSMTKYNLKQFKKYFFLEKIRETWFIFSHSVCLSVCLSLSLSLYLSLSLLRFNYQCEQKLYAMTCSIESYYVPHIGKQTQWEDFLWNVVSRLQEFPPKAEQGRTDHGKRTQTPNPYKLWSNYPLEKNLTSEIKLVSNEWISWCAKHVNIISLIYL